ncbi:MAG TPA: flagellar hook-length control protein FliK [Kofleriaceae bacterium]
MNALALDTTKHAVQPEARDTREAAGAPNKHEFKHQLEKAKPAKKPIEETAAAAPSPAPAQADPNSLGQIIAALLNGAAKPDAEARPAAQAQPLASLAAAAASANAQAAAAATAQGAPDKLVQQMVAVAPEAAPPGPALTPLEQAVHDLLSELADKKSPADDATTAPAGATFQLAPSTLLAPEATPDVQPTGPVAPAPPPAELVSQNHAHLVLDDANGRVVLTVAVRGSEVNVSVRATDDATAAALARNAASLDDAMRGRGLQLAQLDAQRDHAREQHAEKPKYERETVKKANAERFTLEENP